MGPLGTWQRVGWVVCILLGFEGSLLSESRGGWLVLPLALPVCAWLQARCGQRRLAMVGAALILAGMAGLMALKAHDVRSRVDEARQEITQYESKGDAASSVGQRLAHWKLAWSMGLDRPLTGWGRYGYEAEKQRRVAAGQAHPFVLRFSHAHNEVLDIFAKRGLPGVAVLLLFYAVPLALFWPTRQRVCRTTEHGTMDPRCCACAWWACCCPSPTLASGSRRCFWATTAAPCSTCSCACWCWPSCRAASAMHCGSGRRRPPCRRARAGPPLPPPDRQEGFAMHVLLVNNSPIPVYGYGGTERVIWDLGQMLVRLGHRVSYLVPEGSTCDFGAVLPIRPDAPWDSQIPADVDITHFQFNPRTEIGTPYLVTEHGNARKPKPLPRNTVFLSRDHAARYGSTEFVYNGLQWESYGAVDFARPRDHYHFLGKAAWRVKNVSGAIRVAQLAGVELDVLGGDRINFRRGFRWTLSRRIHFFGMVGGAQKTERLNASRGLIFPVRWHEPFGLAVIEPVLRLPRVLDALRRAAGTGARRMRRAGGQRQCPGRGGARQPLRPRACHDHAVRHFGAERMARDYLRMYERVLAGETLNAQAPVIQGEARSLAWRN